MRLEKIHLNKKAYSYPATLFANGQRAIFVPYYEGPVINSDAAHKQVMDKAPACFEACGQ